MVKGTRQKCSHQDVGVVNTEPYLASGQSGGDTRKKAKTGVEDHGDVCLEILWMRS